MAVELTQVHCRLLEEAICEGKLELFDQLCDPGCRFQDPLTKNAGVSEYKRAVTGYRKASPDMKATILACHVHGDTVVTQWIVSGTHEGAIVGFQPSGKVGAIEGISIAQFRNGKIANHSTQWDAAGLIREVGAPAVGAHELRDIAAEMQAS
jgi:steroid delta-isomerase-like uncharacterized protein